MDIYQLARKIAEKGYLVVRPTDPAYSLCEELRKAGRAARRQTPGKYMNYLYWLTEGKL